MSKVVLVNFDKKDYKKFLLNTISDEIEKNIKANFSRLEQYMRAIINTCILKCDEMVSLSDGILGAILGIEAGAGPGIASSIALKTAESMKITIIKNKGAGNRIGLSLRFQIVRADYKDVLSVPLAKYISTNLSGNSTEIPWLSWLLTFGDGIIIADYKVSFGYFTQSRSKKAIMVSLSKSKNNQALKNKFKQGKTKGVRLKRPKLFGAERADSGNEAMGWRIPPRFSGTVDNNFILRAINDNSQAIIDIIKQVLDL